MGAAVRFPAEGVPAAGESDGTTCDCALERHGFYPAGGGRFTVTIEPSDSADRIRPDASADRSLSHESCARWPTCRCISPQREVQTLSASSPGMRVAAVAETVDAHGPGNVTFVELASQHVTEVFTAFGRLGVRAERVADEVVQQASCLPALRCSRRAHTWPINSCCRWASALAAREQPLRVADRSGPCRSPRTRQLTSRSCGTFLDIDIRVDESADGETCCVQTRSPYESQVTVQVTVQVKPNWNKTLGRHRMTRGSLIVPALLAMTMTGTRVRCAARTSLEIAHAAQARDHRTRLVR